MSNIEGWRKFLAYTIVILIIAIPNIFGHPLGGGTMNTIENISYAYLAGQSAIDIIAARSKAQSNQPGANSKEQK